MKIPAVHVFTLLTVGTLSGLPMKDDYAGECKCAPEIPNARAVVSSSCSKIWSENECILKEAGASRPDSTTLLSWATAVYSHISPDSESEAQAAWSVLSELGTEIDTVASRIVALESPDDLRLLEYVILNTLVSTVDERFAAGAIGILRESPSRFRDGWRGERSTFMGEGVRAIADRYCFYAESFTGENFYINFSATLCQAVPGGV